MALKKDSNSLGSDQEKSQNEDASLLELKNLENKKEIESQPLEVSKEDENIFCRDNFERRLLYTAVTRAKKSLDIYYLN